MIMAITEAFLIYVLRLGHIILALLTASCIFIVANRLDAF